MSTLTIEGTQTTQGGQTRKIGPFVGNSAAAVGVTLEVNLASGVNQVSVPTGATKVVVVPPPGNTVTLILRGGTGGGDDAGIYVSPTDPTVISFDPYNPTPLFITASGAMTSPVQFTFS